MAYACSHLATAVNIPITTSFNPKELICADCDCKGPNLWICLSKNCLQIGCAEKANDHSTLHNANHPSHCIHMNLSTRRIWCYECKSEVFMESTSYNDSDQETESYTAKSRDSGHGSYSTLRTNTPERGITMDRSVGLNVGMGGDASDSSDGEDFSVAASTSDCYDSAAAERPSRGLVGLQNIGNTCYMNAALQALSNTEPLTRFFLECASAVHALTEGKKPGLSRTYQALVRDMWSKRGGHGYVTPSGILYGIRNVHATFRGYHQHDTQEFLRNFMDQLHEELKRPAPPDSAHSSPPSVDADTFSLAVEDPQQQQGGGISYDSSEGEEYETCDSGVSERSSLSDDTERVACGSANSDGMGAKRRHSRCGSPNRRQRQRVQSSCVIESQPTANSTHLNKKQPKYRSVISDIFDGKLLSSVQCLTCDRVSSRVETFQDLSLPIPSRDHLVVMHGRSTAPGIACSDSLIPVQDSWIAWIFAWLKSWFYGPTITLHNCLGAFFSTDELKGDNMYSCEKCNKLRNGIKFNKVLQLPEVLCIHLKRFRHELMFSSKISSAVSFPLKGLDMQPYLHKECVSKVFTYELFSVICHHGTAGGGHYTCFALNSGQWYEFDDQYVTKVSSDKVQTCEAYVLFYQKISGLADIVRDQAEKIMEEFADGLKRTYISRQWINRFYFCSEPGPIDNSDFLCHHGSVSPDRDFDIDKIAMVIPYEVYDFLYKKFGGCPPFTNFTICPACLALQKRLLSEMETFLQVSREAQNQEVPHTHYLSTSWYTQWHNFVQKRNQEPPGPIDNTKINLNQLDINEAAEIPESVWTFFHNIYGGGPEIKVKPEKPESEEESDVEFTNEQESDIKVLNEKTCDFEIPSHSSNSLAIFDFDMPENKEVSSSAPLIDVLKNESTVSINKSQSDSSSSIGTTPEFVIPNLRKDRKSVKCTIDKSMYGHGEPMETQTNCTTNLEGIADTDDIEMIITKNDNDLLAQISKQASNNTLTNGDDDIDEEEGKQIRNSEINKRHRRRRKNIVNS